jgi:Skp family chaperone for outer membrane proteins
MNLKITLALAALSSFAIAGSALAQAAAAPAAGVPTGGPPLPGVCTISVERVVFTSAAGISMKTRLEQLQQQSNSELNAEHQTLLQEQSQIEAAAKTTPQEQLEQRVLSLRQRGAAWERKVNQRAQELQATESKQTQRIGGELDPIVKAIFTERHCSILLNSNAILIANPAMDVTQEALQQLNGRLTTLTFERERLEAPQVAASAAPAAAAPAAAAPAPRKKK